MLRPPADSFRGHNREGIAEYDFALPGRVRGHGVSAMLRARNEEWMIWDCLASIVTVFDEIVVIDNGSTDSTMALVQRFKQEHDDRDVVRLLSYPIEIARCGRENARTPGDSVHSAAYWYNWCVARCRHAYVCKWDADMLLLDEGRTPFRTFLQGLSTWRPTMWEFGVQTAYRDPTGRWFLARDEINSEPRIWPNRADVRFYRAELFEAVHRPSYIPIRKWPPVYVYELKDTTKDEFSHWSPEDRLAFPTERKQREWQNFESVRTGDMSAERFTELDPTFLPSRKWKDAPRSSALRSDEAAQLRRIELPPEFRSQ